MNLPEYRAELRAAYQEYRETLAGAADTLEKRVILAGEEFLGHDPEVAMENAPPAAPVIHREKALR